MRQLKYFSLKLDAVISTAAKRVEKSLDMYFIVLKVQRFLDYARNDDLYNVPYTG